MIIAPRTLPLWCDANEYLEVDAWHGAREHRKVLLVEEIIDQTLKAKLGPA